MRLSFGIIKKEWEVEANLGSEWAVVGGFCVEIPEDLYSTYSLCIERTACLFRWKIKGKWSVTHSFYFLK